MPHLYCEKHGREHKARTSERQELYRQEGESVLIVKDRLISGPWLCDSCNAVLKRGTLAYLCIAYPRFVTESLREYDFKIRAAEFHRRESRSRGVRGCMASPHGAPLRAPGREARQATAALRTGPEAQATGARRVTGILAALSQNIVTLLAEVDWRPG